MTNPHITSIKKKLEFSPVKGVFGQQQAVKGIREGIAEIIAGHFKLEVFDQPYEQTLA